MKEKYIKLKEKALSSYTVCPDRVQKYGNIETPFAFFMCCAICEKDCWKFGAEEGSKYS